MSIDGRDDGYTVVDMLRDAAEAYPESIFTPGGTSREAIAADALRAIAVPKFLVAAEALEALESIVDKFLKAIVDIELADCGQFADLPAALVRVATLEAALRKARTLLPASEHKWLDGALLLGRDKDS